MSDIKLRECPFCGGEAKFVKTSMAEYVQCTKCKAETGIISSFKEAAEAWNRRVGERMREICDKCLMCHWYCDDVLEECEGQEEPCHEFSPCMELRKAGEKNE